MTEANAPGSVPDPRIVTPTGGHADRVKTVARYLETNRDRFTEDVLVQAARDAGYPDDVLEEARGRARASAAAAPVTQRARRWIVIAYLLTFAVLTLAMLASEYARSYGAAYIAAVVLAGALGLAFLISMAWLRWRGGSVDRSVTSAVVLLSLPVLLLVAVAGSCLATGLPIPRPS
jgi:hypothetical protein